MGKGMVRLERPDSISPVQGVYSKKLASSSETPPRKMDTVRTHAIKDDKRYDRIHLGAKHFTKKLKHFVWQGNNLCFDAQSQRMIVSDLNESFLPFAADRGAIREADVSRWVDGVTVISSNYPLNQTGAHFYFWAMPAFHLVSFARNVLGETSVNVVFDNITIPARNTLEQGIFEYLFADVPRARRYGKSSMTGITCFRSVIVSDRLFNPAVKMTAYPDDLRYLRKIVEARRGKTMIHSCDESRANHGTIWLAQRRVATRRIDNLDAVKGLIAKVFGPDFRVQDFDSPNSVCHVGHRYCLGHYSCDMADASASCEKVRDVDRDINLFNNMTFFISVHGATAMNLIWMPENSTFLEIFPVGVSEPCYRDFCRRSSIDYVAFQEPNRTRYNTLFRNLDPAQCFSQGPCRQKTKQFSVHVSLAALEKVLISARDAYFRRCKVTGRQG